MNKKVIKSTTTNEIFGYINEFGVAKYKPVYRDKYGLDLPFVCDVDNTIWIPVKEACKKIGLNDSQIKTVLRNCRADAYLKLVTCKIYVEKKSITKNTFVYQKTTCIKEVAFILFLMKLDLLSLSDEAYGLIKNIINKAHKFPILKEFKSEYIVDNFHKEKVLQDKLFNMKKILDVDIIQKEKKYDFGRIDLYGIDSKNNKVCIELKKSIEFKDTEDQLLRYKNSNEFERIIYISNQISDTFKLFLIENEIEFYQYHIDSESQLVMLE
jgi:hypothetical protein